MRAAIIAAGLGLAVHAHMFISSPAPIEGSAPKSPLDASGDNFPCHGVSLPTSGGQTMAAGSSQLLAWDTGDGANTAVHGGGSCQISITYETDADKVKDPSNWFVIYSIEGGCPSNTHQNLDGTYQGPQGSYTGSYDCSDPRTNGIDCVNQFNFTIPKGVKDGHAIMAWTWFNSVGNREMYMNCINTELSGGDGSEMSTLPNMFVGNMASVNQCPTTQSVDLLFPNPGRYTTTKKPSGSAASTAITFPMATPSGMGCAGDGGTASGGLGLYSSSAAPTPVSSAYAMPSAAQSASLSQVTAASSNVTSNALVTVTTVATVTGAPDSAPFSGYTSTITAVLAPSYGSGTETGASSNSSSSSSGCSNGSISCTTPGSLICISESQWGLCDINNCAIPQALAAGTQCSGGSIVKRHMRHVRKHAGHRKGF